MGAARPRIRQTVASRRSRTHDLPTVHGRHCSIRQDQHCAQAARCAIAYAKRILLEQRQEDPVPFAISKLADFDVPVEAPALDVSDALVRSQFRHRPQSFDLEKLGIRESRVSISRKSAFVKVSKEHPKSG